MQFLIPDGRSKTKGRAVRLAIILAIVMFILVAPEVQEGNSMDPTIRDGQVFVVSKTGYSVKRKIPDRDKLVILEKTTSLDAGAEDNIMTRVIALPGDTVEIKEGRLIVNGKDYIAPHGIEGAKGTFSKTKLKGNQVFVMSDNRSSKDFGRFDSRNSKLGLVDMRDIKGDVLLRIWPFKEFAMMTKR